MMRSCLSSGILLPATVNKAFFDIRLLGYGRVRLLLNLLKDRQLPVDFPA